MITSLLTSDVVAKARAAYEAGTLTAQAPHPMDRKRQYRHRDRDGIMRTCAIGAALSDEEAAELEGQSLSGAAITGSPIATTGYLYALQKRHDEWVCYEKDGPIREAAEKAFKNLLYREF